LTLKGVKDEFNSSIPSTVGFEFLAFVVKIQDTIIKLQIWDTCGQEEYRSLISNFYKNCSLAILVYSIDNRKSFENTHQWLSELRNNEVGETKVFLIGNKADLEKE
jgi:small GTP-binding protein